MSTTHNGWIGVDLDGTLAKYDGWQDGTIGEPITAYVPQVRRLIGQGVDVRIVTARACKYKPESEAGSIPELDPAAISAVKAWCETHIGRELPVQFWKDQHMIELWDDRAIQFEKNTGIPKIAVAVKALGIAEKMYFYTRRKSTTIPEEGWQELAEALGIEPEEPIGMIIPSSTLPAKPKNV